MRSWSLLILFGCLLLGLWLLSLLRLTYNWGLFSGQVCGCLLRFLLGLLFLKLVFKLLIEIVEPRWLVRHLLGLSWDNLILCLNMLWLWALDLDRLGLLFESSGIQFFDLQLIFKLLFLDLVILSLLDQGCLLSLDGHVFLQILQLGLSKLKLITRVLQLLLKN